MNEYGDPFGRHFAPFGRSSLLGVYNMVYLAHFVRPNFASLTLRKTSDIPGTLGESAKQKGRKEKRT